MLTINVAGTKLWDERIERFIKTKPCKVNLEYSLLSISKWEAIHHKPFLDNNEKTRDEMLSFLKCMTVTPVTDDNVYRCFNAEHYEQIKNYMQDSMTATWFRNNNRGGNRTITSELVYCWMFQLGIPLDCQKWHFNRLMTLIRVCSEENAPKKKMSKHDAAAQQRAIMAARRKKYNTKG